MLEKSSFIKHLGSFDRHIANLRDNAPFKGTGHYLSPGGGQSIFVVTSEHLRDPPVEYLVF